MDYISKRLPTWTALFSYQKVESPRKIRRCIHLENIFKVLCWNDPYLTWGSFLALNLLFWLTVQLQLKLIGIIFLIILILFLYDSIFVYNEPSETEYSEEIKNVCHVLNSVVATMFTIRKDNPSMFCLLMSVFFLVLGYMAKNISGILISYLMLLGLFFVPAAYQKLPFEMQQTIRECLKSLLTSRDIIDEDDLIPFQLKSKSDDNEVDLESLDTDRTAESVTNSLISGISSMPSFMDADDSEIQEDDLLPVTSSGCHELTPSIGDLSSDSDSELREMKFEETHFTRDSSSDEASQFEEGLNFLEETDSVKPQPATNSLMQGLVDYVSVASNRGSQLSGILTNAITNMKGTNVVRKDSSSDSEFEVINRDDVK